MSKTKLASICFSLSTIIIAIVCFIILPDTLVVQMDAKGNPSNTLPKLAGINLPVVITFIGVYFMQKTTTFSRGIAIATIGIAIHGLNLIFNL